jgi:hypothetical protein
VCGPALGSVVVGRLRAPSEVDTGYVNADTPSDGDSFRETVKI